MSETEREVLRLHGAGLPPHKIAARLGISETTVTWMVANIVSQWGARRTDELSRTLAAAHRGRWLAQLGLPAALMALLTLATALVLGATDTVHGPLATPSSTPQPTSFGSTGPTVSPSAPPAADGAVPTVAPSAGPAAPTASPALPTLAPALPTLAPILPTIAPGLPTVPPVVPTAAPTLPGPLPPLPTVPPLPTPHLPSL